MLFITSLIFLLFLIVSAVKDHGSPLTVFLSIWWGVMFAYSLRLFGIYSVSLVTEISVVQSVLLFSLGYALIGMKSKRPRFMETNLPIQNKNQKFSFGMIKVMVLLDYVHMVPFYGQKLMALAVTGFSLANAKAMLGSMDYDMFSLYVFDPLNFFLCPLTAYLLFHRRSEKFLIISGFVLNGLTFFATGSRARILFLLISVFVMLASKKTVIRRNLKRKAKGFAIFLIFAVVIVSGFNLRLIRSWYFYLCGGIVLLDRIVGNTDAFFLKNGHTYGALSLNGLLRIIPNFIQNYIDSSAEFPIFRVAQRYLSYFERRVNVAPDEPYNSFFTYIGNLYLDFGYAGMLICSFLAGCLCCYAYLRWKDRRDPTARIGLCFLYYMIVFSMVRFSLAGIRIAVGFLYVFVFSFAGKIFENKKIIKFQFTRTRIREEKWFIS